MTPSTPLPEQGGFNERLDAILDQFGNNAIEAFILASQSKGAAELAILSDLEKAEAAIRTLVLEEIIGEDGWERSQHDELRNLSNRIQNLLRREQRKKLGDE